MGFLDKLKNTFFEEEYVEVEEKTKKQPKPKKEILKPQVQVREEVKQTELTIEKEEPVIKDNYEVKQPVIEDKFNYFDEEDFFDYEPPEEKEETKTVVVENNKQAYDNPVYGTKKINNNMQTSPYSKNDSTSKKFTPTPIISPIYGVLDKNYTKDEVQERREIKPTSSYVSRKNADLDSIRAKAFGTSSIKDDFNLTDDVKETEEVEYNDVDDGLEDNLLYDMTEIDKTPSVDKVTLQDAEEYFEDLGLEYNIDYKDVKLEKATGRRVSRQQKIDELEDDEIVVPESMEDEEKIDSLEEVSLEDNLFDLIDSMYEEKE